jgi:type I restriction enzyme S subunit
MLNGLQPYPEYKDSGLPWLGKIPTHWEVGRNGRLFAQRNETGFPDLPILEVSLKTGVRVREFADSKRKQVMADRAKYKRAARGDVAYNMMRMWQGAVGVAPVDGLVSPAYVVAQPQAGTESRYFAYLFCTAAYMNEVNKYSHGIVTDRNRLYWDEFKQMPSAFPPPSEQTAIANFLDQHSNYVRRFIRNKRRLIELLNEQKQAIVDRAVTCGIDPNVHLESSGANWLGDVPEHWEVRRLKQVCQFAYGDSLPDEARVKGDVPVYGSNGQVGYHHVANTQNPCVVIGRKGSFGKVNYSAIPVFAIDTTFFVDERFTSADLRWLFYVLMWARLDSVTKDAAVPGLDRSEAYSKILPWCSQSEQRLIAVFLDHELSNIDVSITQVNREIELIREYRTRLIADVVTGKVDVRRFAPEIIEPASEDLEPLDDGDNFSEEDAEAPEDFELAEESLK